MNQNEQKPLNEGYQPKAPSTYGYQPKGKGGGTPPNPPQKSGVPSAKK